MSISATLRRATGFRHVAAPRLGRARRLAALAAAPTTIPPVTLLTGFLGAGKTSCLRHILDNREDAVVGVIVNDVGALNVDAKVIERTTSVGDGDTQLDVVELSNGCVCCGPSSGSLGPAVQDMVRLAEERGRPLDHVVIELSGVADPNVVETNLGQTGVEVDRIVTLLDGSAFPTWYHEQGTMSDRIDLAGETDLEADPCSAERRVTALLVEQVEAASVIAINKVDLASPKELATTTAAAAALNPDAELVTVAFGAAPLSQLLPFPEAPEAEAAAPGHDHDHDHDAACADAACTDPSHDHDHSHSHGHGHEAAASSCGDPDCTDPTHDHSHSHAHGDAAAAACGDPDCTDPTHDHTAVVEFSESAPAAPATDVDSLGFVTFSYEQRRPFSQRRLLTLIQEWPIPKLDILDLEQMAPGKNIDGMASPFEAVIRSKGYVWLDETPESAGYWTHAGRHFGLEDGGPWWDTVSRPAMKARLEASGAEGAYEATMEKWDDREHVGDRRTELVFIGIALDEGDIRGALDACLLTDGELETYFAGEDEARDAAKAATPLEAPAPGDPLRFAVGDRVVANVGTWEAGTVVAQWYREADWPEDQFAPYQVELDGPEDGDAGDEGKAKIFAPFDDDRVIRSVNQDRFMSFAGKDRSD